MNTNRHFITTTPGGAMFFGKTKRPASTERATRRSDTNPQKQNSSFNVDDFVIPPPPPTKDFAMTLLSSSRNKSATMFHNDTSSNSMSEARKRHQKAKEMLDAAIIR